MQAHEEGNPQTYLLQRHSIHKAVSHATRSHSNRSLLLYCICKRIIANGNQMVRVSISLLMITTEWYEKRSRRSSQVINARGVAIWSKQTTVRWSLMVLESWTRWIWKQYPDQQRCRANHQHRGISTSRIAVSKITLVTIIIVTIIIVTIIVASKIMVVSSNTADHRPKSMPFPPPTMNYAAPWKIQSRIDCYDNTGAIQTPMSMQPVGDVLSVFLFFLFIYMYILRSILYSSQINVCR